MNTAQQVFLAMVGLPLAVYAVRRARAPEMTPDVEADLFFEALGVFIVEFVIFVVCVVFMALGVKS